VSTSRIGSHTQPHAASYSLIQPPATSLQPCYRETSERIKHCPDPKTLQPLVRILRSQAFFQMKPAFSSPLTFALLLLMNATQFHAALRLAIYYTTQLLSSANRSLCASVLAAAVPSEACFDYAECILEHMSEYAKAGMGSGTAMLDLIPAAIALLPGNGPGVDEAFRRGW